MDLSRQQYLAIAKYLISKYPNEAGGVISDNQFYPFENLHPRPKKNFLLPTNAWKYDISGIIHSHTQGDVHPSKTDLTHQHLSGVPWAIYLVDAVQLLDVIWWPQKMRGQVLTGREYLSGIADCYQLIREYSRMYFSVEFPFIPYSSSWSQDDPLLMERLWGECPVRSIDKADMLPGDIVGLKIRSETINHCGIFTGEELLHHLPYQLSKADKYILWDKRVSKVLRVIR